MPGCCGLSQCLVLWSLSTLWSYCVLADLGLLAHPVLSAVCEDFTANTENQWLGYFHLVLAVLAYLCEQTCSLLSGSAGRDGATAPTWEDLLAPLKNLPRFLLDLRLSAWIWALILSSIALSQAGKGSAFPSETTTDSSQGEGGMGQWLRCEGGERERLSEATVCMGELQGW